MRIRNAAVAVVLAAGLAAAAVTAVAVGAAPATDGTALVLSGVTPYANYELPPDGTGSVLSGVTPYDN